MNPLLSSPVPFFARRSMGAATGTESIHDASNELWCFDTAASSWHVLASDQEGLNFPPPRYCGTLIYFAKGLLLFGGRSRHKLKLNYNDFWLFYLAKKQWVLLKDNCEPHIYNREAGYPGYHAKSAHVRLGDYWYMLGGEGRKGHVSDFWRCHLPTRRWEMIQACRTDDPIFW